jgi:hypothetical protein
MTVKAAIVSEASRNGSQLDLKQSPKMFESAKMLEQKWLEPT